jgi:hypothetical protein
MQAPISATKGVSKAAIQALISLKVQYYGESGLYDVLYQSDLQLDGECDFPRVQAQINQTALLFATEKDVSVTLNDRLLQGVFPR